MFLRAPPATCEAYPCSFDDLELPEPAHPGEAWYGMSEFWYTTDDVFNDGGPYQLDIFLQKSRQYCSTDWALLSQRYSRGGYPKASPTRLRLQCFKSAWMHAVPGGGSHEKRAPEDGVCGWSCVCVCVLCRVWGDVHPVTYLEFLTTAQVLHSGYKPVVNPEHFVSASVVGGLPVQWTLGAVMFFADASVCNASPRSSSL